MALPKLFHLKLIELNFYTLHWSVIGSGLWREGWGDGDHVKSQEQAGSLLNKVVSGRRQQQPGSRTRKRPGRRPGEHQAWPGQSFLPTSVVNSVWRRHLGGLQVLLNLGGLEQ